MLNLQSRNSNDDTLSMREALAAISEEQFLHPSSSQALAQNRRMALALDVLETPDVFEVHASVPGVAPDQIDITVLGDGVRIAGEQTTVDTGRATEESDYRWLVRERHVGRFDRSVTLPSPIRADHATAESRDGVLVITLPKAQASSLRTIPVRAGGSTEGRDDAHASGSVIDVDGSR